MSTDNWDGFDDSDDQRMSWEQDAEDIVADLLRKAEFDNVRGVISLPAMYYDPHGRDEDCESLEQVRAYLIEAYEHEWYATVPIDGGEAVFEGDPEGAVDDAMGDDERLEEFYVRHVSPNDTEELAKAGDLLAGLEASEVVRVSLEEINAELITYLAANPEMMREMNSRSFEELVAAMFRNQGYDVTLTPQSKDGGMDIIAVHKDALGTAMILVECKKYASENKVGVEIVRGLYGVVEEKKATRGIIATTSYFTKGAVDFQTRVPNRMGLGDFNWLTDEIVKWKSQKPEK